MTFDLPFESLVLFDIYSIDEACSEVESIVNISIQIRTLRSGGIFIVVIWTIVFENNGKKLLDYKKEIGAEIIKTSEIEEDLPVLKGFIRQTFAIVQNDFLLQGQPINPPNFLEADKQAADVLIDLVKRGLY